MTAAAATSAAPAAPKVASWRRQLRLLRYARPHWRGLAVLIATMLANIALDLLRPWPLKLVLDNVLADNPIPGVLTALPGVDDPHGLLVWVAVATILIFLLGTATEMAYTYCSLLMGQRMTFSLATDVFSHLQRLSVLFHTRRQVGDLIARVTGDTWCVNTMVTDALVPAIQALVTLVAMFAVMWQLQPTLTLLALGVAPFFLIVIKILGGPIKDRNREQRDLEGDMMSVVEQSLSSVPAIQAFTREDHEVRRFRGYADRTVLAYVRSTVAGLWFELFAGLITTIGTAGVIYVGADLALRGELTPGTIIVFLSYLSSLYEPLNSIAQTAPTIQAAAAEADRVSEILEIEPAITDKRGARDARMGGAIRFESVTFGYEPGRPVLHDVSFDAQPGETIAIVGPTGAGKTTMMNLLVRFFDPWEGAITVGGVDLRDVRHKSLREQIGMVLQDPFIFPVTIAENIAYGRPDAALADIEAAAVAANAHTFIERAAAGLRHGRRRARRHAVGRREAAVVDRARVPQGRAGAHPRRADLGPRRAHRGRAARGARAPHARPDLVRRRAPAVDDPRGEPHPRARRRAHRRVGLTRRAPGRGRPVLGAVPAPDGPRRPRRPGPRGGLTMALRIAQIAPVAAPVRPGDGDSIEQLVGLLCDELVRRGHDVTLYATGDSVTRARLRSRFDRGYDEDPELWDWQYSEVLHAAAAFEHAAEHDVVHAHDLHFALPFAGLVDVPIVDTQHIGGSPEVRDAQRRAANVHVVVASEEERRMLGPGIEATVIPHGINIRAFPFSPASGDHLLFLGRMIPDKGPLEAIEIARAAGRRLVLAGPLVEGYDLGLDELVDGEQVRYLGRVDHPTRNRLLGEAAALLFPVRYPEPFGLVMIEAMACGTPVLGVELGAVREIVEPGVTGFTSPSWQGLAELVEPAVALDRLAIRERALARFDYHRMVDGYEALYERVVARGRTA